MAGGITVAAIVAEEISWQLLVRAATEPAIARHKRHPNTQGLPLLPVARVHFLQTTKNGRLGRKKMWARTLRNNSMLTKQTTSLLQRMDLMGLA